MHPIPKDHKYFISQMDQGIGISCRVKWFSSSFFNALGGKNCILSQCLSALVLQQESANLCVYQTLVGVSLKHV